MDHVRSLTGCGSKEGVDFRVAAVLINCHSSACRANLLFELAEAMYLKLLSLFLPKVD